MRAQPSSLRGSRPISDLIIPDPTPAPDTQAFWDQAAVGNFAYKACCECGKAHWYPRSACPFCFSADTEWREASGRGSIYSFSVMRRAATPYVLAYVTLEEGPRMMTNIVDCDFEKVRIGDPVQVCFKTSESGYSVPMFTISA